MVFAGSFGAWLSAARASLRGEGSGMDVPCGECRGCCTSSLFSNESKADERAHAAVRAAAAFIRDERASFPGGAAPSLPSEIAVLALKVYPVFLERSATAADTAAAVIAASREFDQNPAAP